ncbi:MAG: M48 family metallopeptidase [bacterium]
MATTYSHIAANKRKSVILLAFFVLIIAALGWLVDYVGGSGTNILILAVFISLIMSLAGYFQGDKIALWSAGAKPSQKQDNPYLYRMIENLAITSGLPMPKVYLIPDPALNAFATGRNPQRASIAVTQGLVDNLENEELEGVLAHEMSHIGNYDIRFMMLVAVLVGIIVIFSDIFLRATLWGGMSNRRDRSSVSSIFAVMGLVLIILSPIVAQFIKLAASRKREYLADASGALLTRYPEGLATALEKISTSRPMLKKSNATAHLYISNPFGRSAKGLSRLFSTHPPIEERIKILRQMSH